MMISRRGKWRRCGEEEGEVKVAEKKVIEMIPQYLCMFYFDADVVHIYCHRSSGIHFRFGARFFSRGGCFFFFLVARQLNRFMIKMQKGEQYHLFSLFFKRRGNTSNFFYIFLFFLAKYSPHQ